MVYDTRSRLGQENPVPNEPCEEIEYECGLRRIRAIEVVGSWLAMGVVAMHVVPQPAKKAKRMAVNAISAKYSFTKDTYGCLRAYVARTSALCVFVVTFPMLQPGRMKE